MDDKKGLENKKIFIYIYKFLLLYLKSSIIAVIVLYIIDRYDLSTGHWFVDYFLTFTIAFIFVRIFDFIYFTEDD
jgi:glucan phosphoethanolaminetransferase (alkaline phosphatase superfamily)